MEEDTRRYLAKTIQGRNLAEVRLEQLKKEHQSTVESRRMKAGEIVDLERWRAIERYLVILEHCIDRAKIDLRDAEKLVVDAKQALTKAHQAHLMLLRLKERRQEQHEQEVLQEEYRMQDELAVLRYRFNTRPQTAADEVSP